MAFSALLAACVAIDVPPDPLTDDAVVTANNKFTLEYFKANYDERINYIASPYHVRLALSMFYPVAGAAVQEDFQVAFGLPQDTLQAVEQQGRLAKRMNDGRHVKALSFVLVEESLPLKTEFERLFLHTFDTTVEPVDLTDDIPSAAAVNSFYRMASTEIEDFICEGDVFSLEPCFKLMLFSGVSVLAPLGVRFDPANTRMAQFRFVNAPEQRVAMMRTTASVRYCHYQGLQCAAVELPFEEASGLSLLLLLPDEGITLGKVVADLSLVTLDQIDERLQLTRTEVIVPKMIVREKTEPKTILAKLGFGGVFEIDDLRVFQDIGRTRLNGFFQHCYVAICESGTGTLDDARESVQAEFHANRPFVFFVRQTTDGNILQMGQFSKYVDPDEQF